MWACCTVEFLLESAVCVLLECRPRQRDCSHSNLTAKEPGPHFPQVNLPHTTPPSLPNNVLPRLQTSLVRRQAETHDSHPLLCERLSPERPACPRASVNMTTCQMIACMKWSRPACHPSRILPAELTQPDVAERGAENGANKEEARPPAPQRRGGGGGRLVRGPVY